MCPFSSLIGARQCLQVIAAPGQHQRHYNCRLVVRRASAAFLRRLRYVGRARYSVFLFSQPDVFFLLVPIASFILVALIRYARHHCPYHDPLCRRNRPCIGCYRKLFINVNAKNQ